ncbi:MAG: helix-turn-helix domain-containing protein [Victivallaceae bacterium]|jgi:AraC-like DNA-binding protein
MNELIELIGAFERRCGLKICFHDYSGRIRNYFHGEKFKHDNKYCEHIKDKCGLGKCMSFETRNVQIALAGHPDGFFKLCHAGVIEYAAPIMEGPDILGTIFIGIFRLKYPAAIPDAIACRCGSEDVNHELHKELPYIEQEDFKDIEEIAKSLKSRIEILLAREEVIFFSHEKKIKWEIEKYIGQNCQKNITIQHLAKHLCLSVSRTGQLVKKLFNMTYPELLNKNRISNAKALLSSTSLTISETAYRCGFSDPAYFHRIFRKLEKNTPGEYKIENNRTKNMLI